MEEKEAKKVTEEFQQSNKPESLSKKESERPLDNKESFKPPASRYTEDIIEEISKITITELDQPGGWKKLLIVMYRDKAIDNRQLQEKINALIATNSEQSRKLGVAQERLRSIAGMAVTLTILIAIAGAILSFVGNFPDGLSKKVVFISAIAIFAICAFYLWRIGKNQEKVE
jgi:hypothetical protein